MIDPLWARTSDKSKPRTDPRLKLVQGTELSQGWTKSPRHQLFEALITINYRFVRDTGNGKQLRQIQITGMKRITSNP